jgi:hypothetical protein
MIRHEDNSNQNGKLLKRQQTILLTNSISALVVLRKEQTQNTQQDNRTISLANFVNPGKMIAHQINQGVNFKRA